eukprot:8749039-Alexandrium_andersonii.AAC.1
MGQTAFSNASCIWTCGVRVSNFRQFHTAERAVWPVARAGTVAPSSWPLGPVLTLTRGPSDS